MTGKAPLSLGPSIARWIQTHCVIPDGEHQGDPFLLTPEMLRFLVEFYAVNAGGTGFVHNRGAQLVRPQKWGKGPFSAAIICAEAYAEVRPDGLDGVGRPRGRRWATPLIQVTAVSEDQTDNVWRALIPMIRFGPLTAEIPDAGETRINVPGGGRIEPVTSSARSRLGQRVTFVVQDETHSWLETNGGRRLADNQRRNLSGMGGRFLETTNAWDPVEESVAQQTAEAREPGVYFDDVDPGTGSIRNKRERHRCMRKVYGDSATAPPGAYWRPWVQLDRIDAEIEALLPRDPAQAERFFLNRKHAAEGAAFDAEEWKQLVELVEVPRKSLIVIGVDGARFDDALAIVATDVVRAHQWPLGIWEAPPFAGDEYEHPSSEIDGVMSEAFSFYDVWRVYVDPQRIEDLFTTWQGRWTDKRVQAWYTNRPRQIAYAVRAYRTAMHARDFTHDGDERFGRHVANARRRKVNVYDEDHRQMWTLAKDRPGSPRKIDAAMSGAISWEARSDAVAAGMLKRRSRVPVAM